MKSAALPVRVTLEWPSGGPAAALVRVHIQAVRIAGPDGDGVPVEGEAGPNGTVLDLGEGVWQVQAFASGYWSQGTKVAISREPVAGVRLALWPAATLQGEIQTDEGEPPPTDIDVRLSAAEASAGKRTELQKPAPHTEVSPASADLRCRVDYRNWNCVGPAGRFDVQLEAAGYAPRYAWGVNLKTGSSTDLGKTVLRRGTSLFGRALRSDGSNPQGPCRATLHEELPLRGPEEPEADNPLEGKTSFSGYLTRRGYFQLTGMPPGKYALDVECATASAVRELAVQENREMRIDPPLLLEEQKLEVAVTPAVDPEGQPWQLNVEATTPRLRRIADRAKLSADGRWTRRGLTAGSYRVELRSSDGKQWLQRFFKLNASSGPLSLNLAFVAVAGRVMLSNQPLGGRLVFYNESGGEPATLISDEGGHFHGLLPAAPGVQETHWTVEVHAEQPAINRRLEGIKVQSAANQTSAWVELALPTFAVHGTVVSQSGESQSGVQITVEGANSKISTSTATDDQGDFQVRTLPPGDYTAVAKSMEGASERTPFEVVEGIESEVRLVLNQPDRIPFYVVSSQGPVANATVQVWIAPGVPWGFVRTDAEGRFEAKVPPGTTELGITIAAPGYALKLVRQAVSDDHTITLEESGARLVLDLHGAGQAASNSTTPYLVHDGAVEAVGTLADTSLAPEAPVVVEPIEPGDYALCFADPGELAALWRGPLRMDRCRKGSIEDGEALTLSAP